jgi:hypothetical protein
MSTTRVGLAGGKLVLADNAPGALEKIDRLPPDDDVEVPHAGDGDVGAELIDACGDVADGIHGREVHRRHTLLGRARALDR